SPAVQQTVFRPKVVLPRQANSPPCARSCPRVEKSMGSHISVERDTRTVMDGLRHVVRVLRVAARAAEKRAGVSGAQLFVLQKLDGQGALSIGELAGQTATDQSSVSVVVSRLADRKLVARKHGTRDARRVEVSLTSRGKAVLR